MSTIFADPLRTTFYAETSKYKTVNGTRSHVLLDEVSAAAGGAFRDVKLKGAWPNVDKPARPRRRRRRLVHFVIQVVASIIGLVFTVLLLPYAIQLGVFIGNMIVALMP